MQEAIPVPDVRARRAEIEAPVQVERYSSLRRLASDPDRRFVVSMGGGAVPALCGNVALAVLLEELGLRGHVAEVWGTSAGAIVGGSWASGTTSARMLEILRSLPSRRMIDIGWLQLAKGLLLRPFGGCLPDALLRGQRSHRAMLEGLAVSTFEECEIPFRCIACTDDPRRRTKVFREGPLADAISASTSLPGFLLPLSADGSPALGFMDGGLVEKTPLFSPVAEHTRLGDGRDLFVLGTYFGVQEHPDGAAQGFIDRFFVTIETLADHLWEHQADAARRHPGVTVLMTNPPFDGGSGPFDFSRIEENYLLARESFRAKLENASIALTLGTSCGPRRPCPA